MDIVTLLPFIVLIGAMFLMTRSAKKKQQAAVTMRNSMQPGTGVRTIGGMYATVKEISDDAVTLEVAPGVHAIYAKNAIGSVLEDDEYNRIVHGATAEELTEVDEHIEAPDDASALTEDDAARIDLGKKDSAEDEAPEVAKEETPKKTDGDDAK